METAGNSKKTAKPRGRAFVKGQSGNPNGRPKQSPEQKDALESIRSLAPDAADQLHKMIMSEDTPPAARIRAIEIVLDRTYGKADATIKLETPKAERLDDLRAYMDSIKAASAK